MAEAQLKDILEKLVNILQRLVELERKVIMLGQSCSRAFDQTKEVVNALAENQSEMGESIGEIGCSWT